MLFASFVFINHSLVVIITAAATTKQHYYTPPSPPPTTTLKVFTIIRYINIHFPFTYFLQRVHIARNAERCTIARGILSVRHVPVLCPDE